MPAFPLPVSKVSRTENGSRGVVMAGGPPRQRRKRAENVEKYTRFNELRWILPQPGHFVRGVLAVILRQPRGQSGEIPPSQRLASRFRSPLAERQLLPSVW